MSANPMRSTWKLLLQPNQSVILMSAHEYIKLTWMHRSSLIWRKYLIRWLLANEPHSGVHIPLSLQFTRNFEFQRNTKLSNISSKDCSLDFQFVKKKKTNDKRSRFNCDSLKPIYGTVHTIVISKDQNQNEDVKRVLINRLV